MDQCKVVAVYNRKGGTGKTTLTMNLGAGLADRGYQVLLVDADPQANLTMSLGHPNPASLHASLQTELAKLLSTSRFGDGEEGDGILNNSLFLDLLPGTPETAYLESRIREEPDVMSVLIDGLRDRYDYILIDCPSADSPLTLSVLGAADGVIIPVDPSHLTVKSLDLTVSAITKARWELNPELDIWGIVINMADRRTKYAQAVIGDLWLNNPHNLYVFCTEIPRTIRLPESVLLGRSIYEHDPKGKAAMAYEDLTEEVLELGKSAPAKGDPALGAG